MFNQTKWVAVVRDKDWLLAKISRSKLKLNIKRLSSFNGGEYSDSAPAQAAGYSAYTYESAVASQETTHPSQGEEARSEQSDDYPAQLKAWLRKQKVPLKKLKLAYSCPGIITRIITLPVLKPKDLDKLLTEQVDQYFTLNISDYVVDYRVVDRFEEDGQMRQRILLAAIPKFQWERLCSTLDNAGFKPKVIDLAADALVRLYSRLGQEYKPRKPFKQEKEENSAPPEGLDIAIVDLNSGRSEFILLEHGIFFLYSDLELNLEDIHDLVMHNANLASKENELQGNLAENSVVQDRMAENISNGLSQETSEAMSRELLRSQVEMALAPVFRALADYLNFFAARHYGKSVDCIYVTGEYANLPFLSDIFESNLEVVTCVGFPHSWRPHFKKKLRSVPKEWMKYGSLYGLALREE